jgi:molybdopterin converting factor subunit 1
MRVKLLCFGVLKDLLGLATEEVQVPEGSSVADLLRNLEQRTSNSVMDTKVWQSLAVAVNREYSPADTVLRDGDEVALLPPVSGGCHAR